jgi:hypothetical protein
MSEPKAVLELFNSDLKAVNMGLESFAETLRKEQVPTVQVDWRPPAGGDPDLIDALDRIEKTTKVDVEAANAEAVDRILKGKPVVVGIGKALDVVPGMRENLILHAGPPVTWDRMCGPMRGPSSAA